ncbi:MAG: phosphoenolpyruvate carboxykinase (GTP) [Zetaproteobacteria bacterium]|nr:phosphoenolpyruvate carboxykinase (GTP) [Zetaproteobacteria bacterium]
MNVNVDHHELVKWVQEVEKLTQPEKVVWCNGSEEEYQTFTQQMLQSGDFLALNQQTHPGCYLHRSSPDDVARTEHLTFVCTHEREDAGPNNNWMSPEDGHNKVDALFAGCMRGRTMYVVPYCMGPLDSPFSRCGVEITDSLYVVVNMKIMTRMGEVALKKILQEKAFVRGLHSTGDLKIENRLIMHFPEELMIKSIGSGYGGNALLGKKCHALRIGSYQARSEGWLAEHMLILGLESPEGEKTYIAAAFPSQCGKTNLAMLIPPESYQGWKIWTVGDDIAWIHPGEDGRLYAINPEAGFFGVAPGTSEKTNPNAMAMLNRDAIFTNVGVTEDQQPWWEGLKSGDPVLNWRGESLSEAPGQPVAHPNSRFTVSAKQCPSYTEEMESPHGVPLSAIIFGGRRPSLIPLVFEAKSWAHGVWVGASVGSETTAAATGQVGVLRRDPMAMKPFCGYNFADYWGHWLEFADKPSQLPKIFHVNWFRQTDAGEFIWPGFGENIRVLEWIVARCRGKVEAKSTPIGYVPHIEDISRVGLKLSQASLEGLLTVDRAGWQKELESTCRYMQTYGDRLPSVFSEIQEEILADLKA